MAHAVHLCIRNVLAKCVVPTQHERSIVGVLLRHTQLCFIPLVEQICMESRSTILCSHWIGTVHCTICGYTPCTIDFSWGFWYGTLPCPFTFEGAKLLARFNECCRMVQVLCPLSRSCLKLFKFLCVPTQHGRGTYVCIDLQKNVAFFMYSIGSTKHLHDSIIILIQSLGPPLVFRLNVWDTSYASVSWATKSSKYGGFVYYVGFVYMK